jgi:hypothetical protein
MDVSVLDDMFFEFGKDGLARDVVESGVALVVL